MVNNQLLSKKNPRKRSDITYNQLYIFGIKGNIQQAKSAV